MSGFYRMKRGWMDNPALDGHGEPFCRRAAWAWLIERAGYDDRKVDLGGKTVTLKRGQLCDSYRYMADAWRWSVSSVQRFLKRLETDTMIGTQTDTGRVVITICNYERYQTSAQKSDTRPDTQTDTPAIRQRYEDKEVKEVREKEPNGSSSQTRASAFAAIRPEFDAVWKQYPRKVDRDRAFKAYARARKSGAPADEIMRGVMRYGQECADREPRFIKHFATFLNAGSWTNEPEPCTPDRTAAEQRSPRHDGSATGRGLPRDEVRAAILRGLDLVVDAGGSGAGRGDPAAPGGDRGGGAAP